MNDLKSFKNGKIVSNSEKKMQISFDVEVKESKIILKKNNFEKN